MEFYSLLNSYGYVVYENKKKFRKKFLQKYFFVGSKRMNFQKTQFTIIKVLECLCVILAESKNGNSYNQIF